MGASWAVAGFWGGMSGGALGGGLENGWQGAFLGALSGGTLGYLAGAGGPVVGIGMFVAGAAYAGATDNWDSFAGGAAGLIAGTAAGATIVESKTFRDWRLGGADRSAAMDQAFKDAEYALNVNQAAVNDDPPVEIYLRGLEGANGEPQGGKVHPYMRDSWKSEFHELQDVNGRIKILEGDIDAMSKGTRIDWGTHPRPFEVINVSKSKFYVAIESYKNTFDNRQYKFININLSGESIDRSNCIGFVDYVIKRSKL